MTERLWWLVSVLWLALKIALILFLLSPQGTAFVYQNF
jgi:hypothetical protein